MEPGTKVQVIEYGGRKLTRVVVSDRGRSVVVCNEKEYAKACAEQRQPEGIGFPRDAVSELESRKASE